ncbi:hypothetical protein HPY42_00550 [Coprothermobacteraceae bacterium]|nr:hypothetical protein [Coprothermobacteraceae bacterium]
MATLLIVFSLCAAAVGLLSLVQSRWSKLAAIVLGLIATGYGWLHELSTEAESISFAFFNSQVAYMWTAISRVFWPLVLFTLTFVYVALYEVRERRWIESFVALTLINALGIFLVFTSRSFLALFLGWEVMSWSGLLIVKLTATSEKPVRSYLAWSVASGVLLLAGALLMSKGTWDLSFNTVVNNLGEYDVVAMVGLALAFVAFLIKLGIPPFHLWVPTTYEGVDPMVSAYLSGAMTKAGVFGVVLLVLITGFEWFAQFGMFRNIPWVSFFIDGVIIAGAVVATIRAWSADDASVLLAYSSIAQLSYVVIALVLMKVESYTLPAAFMGAMLLSYAHTLFEVSLFIPVGWIYHQVGTKSIASLGGAGHKMPVTFMFGFVAILSAVAIPPLVGFAAKFLIYESIVEMKVYVLSALALVVGAGAFMYAFRYVYGIFWGQIKHEYKEVSPVGIVLGLFSIALTVLLGIFNTSFQQFLTLPLESFRNLLTLDFETTTSVGGWHSAYLLALFITAGLIALLVWSSGAPARWISPRNTWYAGEPPKPEWNLQVSSHFYGPFERILDPYAEKVSLEKWLQSLSSFLEKAIGDVIRNISADLNASALASMLLLVVLAIVAYVAARGGVLL